MKNFITILAISISLMVASCNNAEVTKDSSSDSQTPPAKGQSGVVDATSTPNIVQVASGSKDHTTLVAAVVAAELVDALSNAGPFTVFAPTNAAFAKLSAGTVEGLLKPENKEKLQNILGYHTYVGNLKTEYMNDGQTFGQVFGGNIKISKKDGKIMVNDKATIIATIPTSNGIIHVIDEVLLPQ